MAWTGQGTGVCVPELGVAAGAHGPEAAGVGILEVDNLVGGILVGDTPAEGIPVGDTLVEEGIPEAPGHQVEHLGRVGCILLVLCSCWQFRRILNTYMCKTRFSFFFTTKLSCSQFPLSSGYNT